MPLDKANGKPLLNVEGLTTYFDITGGLFGTTTARVHAVEDVSFHIMPGETLAMVGESGCGQVHDRAHADRAGDCDPGPDRVRRGRSDEDEPGGPPRRRSRRCR